MTDRELSYEDFAARVGQSFIMRFGEMPSTAANPADEYSCEIVLTDCARSTVPGASRAFNLTFRTGPDAPREQGLYLLSRDDFPSEPIFLVPVRALADGLEFHAAFNPIDGG